MKLKTRIILSVALSFIVCSLALALLAYNQSGLTLKEEIADRQAEAAHKTAEVIDQWFAVRKNIIKEASAYAGKTDVSTPEAMLDLFKSLQDSGGFMSVYAGFASGEFFDSSGWEPPSDYDHRVRPWYKDAMESGEVVVTKPYSDANTGDMIISISTVIKSNGKNIGVASGDIAINYIVEMVISTKTAGNGYSFVTDRNGEILIHPSKDTIGKKLGDLDPSLKDVVRIMSQKDSGSLEYLFNMEVEKLTSFALIPATNWLVQVSANKDDLFAPLKKLLWEMLALGGLFILAGALVAYFIARNVAQPVEKTMYMLSELAKGHLSGRLNLKRKDEIGAMAETMDRFADSLQNDVIDSLQRLANGDLTFDVVPADQDDVLRHAIKTVKEDLNDLIGQIQAAGDQIDSASGQVSDSSQSLSQGATETAASLEEISSSINEIAAQATQSSVNANEANTLADNTKQAATEGSNKMKAMVQAMEEINDAGQNISKIIKVIDEIAFQTNLLALNAAVEAARAGQHGKGFAVVAEEVRNLAARSAKAAKETEELIQGSVQKTEGGRLISSETSKSLETIVSSITKVADLVAEIDAASGEQAQGISQINQGLSQIDQSVQQNTATAEESAAASEELSSQAAQLKHMLSRFVLAEGFSSTIRQPVAPKLSLTSLHSKNKVSGWGDTPVQKQVQIALDDTELGKF